VDITEEFTPFLKILAKNIVEIVAQVRFTILFPTKIVLISLSNLFSTKFKTFSAFLFPALLIARIFILFTQEKAVSVKEKQADSKISIIMQISSGTEPSGIVVLL